MASRNAAPFAATLLGLMGAGLLARRPRTTQAITQQSHLTPSVHPPRPPKPPADAYVGPLEGPGFDRGVLLVIALVVGLVIALIVRALLW